MTVELRTMVVEPVRNTFDHIAARFGDKPASRYQEGSFDVQPKENFHYRPTWDPAHQSYDPDYTALKLTDTYSYADPRQFYYTTYVASAAEHHDGFLKSLKYIEDRDLLGKMPEEWRTLLADYILPLRHYESAGQLISCNASRFAWGTTIEQAACFAGFDRIGNAQLLSLIGLALGGGTAEPLVEAKGAWLDAAPVQGLRRLVEELLIEPDWAVGLLGLDLADAQLYPLLWVHLDERAVFRGASAYSLLAQHFSGWYGGQRKWLDPLLKAWTNDPEHADANRDVLNGIAGRWYPQVTEAVRAWADGVAADVGSDSIRDAAAKVATDSAAHLAKFGITAAADATEGAPA